MADTQVLLEGLHFAECPRWHDGRLWFSDFYDHRVRTVDLEGNVADVVEVPHQPSGLGWLPDGRLLVVSMVDQKVLRLDDDRLVEHADLSGIASFHCNDMVVDAEGRAYVGNFGFDLFEYLHEHGVEGLLTEPGPPRALLARVDPDGDVHVAADGLLFPNGAVITPDGSTLIIAETVGRRLSAFDIQADGSLHHRRVWADLGFHSPDGICLDAEGNVWVANPLGPECVLYAEGGVALERVETTQPCFACMLGGPDRRTLFLLTAPTAEPHVVAHRRDGRIETAQVGVGGAGWP